MTNQLPIFDCEKYPSKEFFHLPYEERLQTVLDIERERQLSLEASNRPIGGHVALNAALRAENQPETPAQWLT